MKSEIDIRSASLQQVSNNLSGIKKFSGPKLGKERHGNYIVRLSSTPTRVIRRAKQRRIETETAEEAEARKLRCKLAAAKYREASRQKNAPLA